MSVAVGVAVEEILHFLQIEVAGEVETLQEGIGRHAVEREDVDVYAAYVAQVHALDECCAGVLYLGEGQGIVGVGLVADDFQWSGHPVVGMLHEQVVVLARHAYVKVVVPGDESFVAHGSEECACNDVVSQVVSLAYLLDGEQYVEDA